MTDLIFNHYEYFLAIVTAGNITRAAESLYISQPSLTQYLKQLEKRVGAELIDRGTSPLSLTPAGNVYYRYVLDYEKMMKKLEAELQEKDAGIRGKLDLGIPIQLQPMFMEAAVMPFMKAYPSVKVSVNGSTSPTLEKMTARGRLSAAIIHILKENYEELEYRILREDPVVIACSRQHRLAAGKKSSVEAPVPVKMEDLRDELFYLMEPNFILRQAPDEVFHRTGIYPKRIIQLSNVYTAISMAAAGGEGLAFLTESSYSICKDADKLAFLTIEDEPIRFLFTICFRKQDPAPQIRAFAERVCAGLKERTE